MFRKNIKKNNIYYKISIEKLNKYINLNMRFKEINKIIQNIKNEMEINNNKQSQNQSERKLENFEKSKSANIQ